MYALLKWGRFETHVFVGIVKFTVPIACPVARERVLPPQHMRIRYSDMPTRFTVPIASPAARERVLPPQHLRIRYSDVPTKSESDLPCQ